jgi:ribose 5-phosphate isomerase A
MNDTTSLKRLAAEEAVAEVEDGMVLGLGSGSTSALALEAIARRIRSGLRVAGIATSERTAGLADRLGIPLTGFDRHRRLDLTIDGADQVERATRTLIKGGGGALLREKIVAAASDRVVIAVDQSKLADRLGGAVALPVEVVSFGWQATQEKIAAIGCATALRTDGARPFVTDGGNYIIDCAIAEIADPLGLDAALCAIPGVIATGLFIGLATVVIVGCPGGVERL